MNNSETYNEPEILQRLKEGSESAFTQLFERYRVKLYSVAFKFLKSSVLAEETVQDVFLKIWLKRSELPVIKNFEGYLFIMGRNFIFDRIKKMAYEKVAQTNWNGETAFTEDAEYLIRRHQCELLLQKAIELLPPQQKQVYSLARKEGMSHEKIAEHMKLSRVTVKTHMAKALQNIRRYLDGRLNNVSLTPFLIASIFFQ